MKSIAPILSALLALALLAGCAVPAAPATAPAAAETPVTATDPSDQRTRTIQHALGETEITGTPQRVVALEWIYVEDLLALGLQPVGVADIAGYNSWVNIPLALAPDVVDVGTRNDPNLETLATLQPDLILVPLNRIDEAKYAALSAIAPTLVFDHYPADQSVDQFAGMIENFRTVADVVGRQAEAEAVIAQMEAKFAQARATLEAAGKAGEKFILAQGYTGNGAATVRLFIENALAIKIIEQIGLELGWNSGWQEFGFSTVSVETLPELGDLHFFYVVQDDDNIFASEAIAPLWENLEFVKNGHAYSLGGGTWLFGGPLSAEVLVDLVISHLVPDAASAPAADTAGEAVTISHERGETTFTSIPQRVVVLEYSYLDALFVIDVMPVGYPDDGVPAYLLARLAGSDAVAVGTRAEPNLEAIVALQPDLIIADLTRHETIYDQLAAIAPTLLFDSYRGSYETQLVISEELGKIFGKAEVAAAAVAEVRQALAEARQLATGHERSVVVGVFAGTGFTAHSNASFKGSLLIDLGLTTPLEPLDGQTQYLLDLEGIAAAAPEAFVVTCSPADQGIWDEFASQPVWQGLQAVRNNAVYLFNRDLWSRSRGIIALHLILRDARESGLLTGEPSTYTSCPEPVIE